MGGDSFDLDGETLGMSCGMGPLEYPSVTRELNLDSPSLLNHPCRFSLLRLPPPPLAGRQAAYPHWWPPVPSRPELPLPPSPPSPHTSFSAPSPPPYREAAGDIPTPVDEMCTLALSPVTSSPPSLANPSPPLPCRAAAGDVPTLVDEMGRETRMLETDVPAGKCAVHVVDKVWRGGGSKVGGRGG